MIKQGDLVPGITATLMQAVGSAAAAPIDLTTASAIKFAMRRNGALKVDGTAAAISAADGTVGYQWVTGDTDTAGLYDCEWQITWPAGKQTVPGGSYDQVYVMGDIST